MKSRQHLSLPFVLLFPSARCNNLPLAGTIADLSTAGSEPGKTMPVLQDSLALSSHCGTINQQPSKNRNKTPGRQFMPPFHIIKSGANLPYPEFTTAIIHNGRCHHSAAKTRG